MKHRILIGSSTGVALVALNAVVMFATIPIFYRYLGEEYYGVYAVITAIGIVGNFINFGFNISMIKTVGEHGASSTADRDIVGAFTLAGCLVSAVVTVGIVFRQAILADVLNIPDHLLLASTQRFYLCVLFSNVFLFLGEIPASILDSINKIHVTNSLQMVNVLINRFSGAIALMFGAGLAEVGYFFLSASLIWFILLLVFFFRYWRFQSFHGLFSGIGGTMKRQLSYGYKMLMTGIAGFFYEPFMKVLISRYIGISEVGAFDIAFRLKNILWNIILRILYPFTPVIAAQRDASAVASVVDRISRVLFMVTFPLIAVAISVTGNIINVWMGNGHPDVVFATTVIVAGYLFLMSSIPVYQFLQLKDHPEKNFYIQILNAVLSFLLFVLLVPSMGFSGAIIAFVGAVFITNFLSIYYQWRYIRSILFVPVSKVFISLCVALFLFGLHSVTEHFFPVQNYMMLGGSLVLDLLVVGASLAFFDLVSITDVRQLLHLGTDDRWGK